MLPLKKQEIQDKVSLALKKAKIDTPKTCAVRAYFDTSGSFRSDWERGTVGLVAERVLAVANRFDDDGNLDILHFHNDVFSVGTANFMQIDGVQYLKENVLSGRSGKLWYGTSFAPIVEDAIAAERELNGGGAGGGFGSKMKALFGSKPAAPSKTTPVLAYIITDGENDDYGETERLMNESQNGNVYFMFVNVQSMAANARKLADKFPHVGYVFIPNLSAASDDDIIQSLVTEEYGQWRDKFGA